MKTLKLLLWLMSMSFNLVFVLISFMNISNFSQPQFSYDNFPVIFEPVCYIAICICLSLTPVRIIAPKIRYILASSGTLILALYYVYCIGAYRLQENHNSSALYHMDAWIILTLVLMSCHAILLYKIPDQSNNQTSEEEYLLTDPLFHTTNNQPTPKSSEEIEMEISGASLSEDAKRWRRPV